MPKLTNMTAEQVHALGKHCNCKCGGHCHDNNDGNVLGIAIVHQQDLNIQKVIEKLQELQESASSLYDEITDMLEDMQEELENCDDGED